MKVISLQEIRKMIEEAKEPLDEMLDILGSEVLVVDIPAPEKKVRKKRMKKEKAITLGPSEQASISPHKPRRGRKGPKKKDTFYGTEEKFNTPVEQS